MLVILRDCGIPLPAGAILISPWVDLTHSFPSVAGDDEYDYIPANGFLQRPSAAWPPPNADDMQEIALHAVENVVQQQLPRKSTQAERDEATEEAVQGFSVDHDPSRLNARANPDNPAGLDGGGDRPGNTIPGPGHELSIMLDGDLVTIKDQIQMYATNQLIAHPLVSPVLQPSLGGLPPLLIQTGGGEVLRDEQIYLAHKAANPPKYPPGEIFLDQYPDAREIVKKWKPTNVQLQVWDDLCHVAPTLSFTRPAKFMYRSIAQFGAWALARAQKIEIEILDDDDVSIISSGSDTDSDSSEMTKSKDRKARDGSTPTDQVGKAGDLLPPFKNHMIRQRIDRHGAIYPLDPPSSLPGLQMPANEIGVIKPGPVSKWLTAKKQWEKKFAREKRRVQEQRAKEMAKGFQGFGNADVPPPSALAGRRGLNMPKEAKKGRSWGMSLWSLWGSSHDEKTVLLSLCLWMTSMLISSRLNAKRKRIRVPKPSSSRTLMAPMTYLRQATQRRLSLGRDLVGAQSQMQAKRASRTKTSTRIRPPQSSFAVATNKLTVAHLLIQTSSPQLRSLPILATVQPSLSTIPTVRLRLTDRRLSLIALRLVGLRRVEWRFLLS